MRDRDPVSGRHDGAELVHILILIQGAKRNMKSREKGLSLKSLFQEFSTAT